ncbi:hypothetical protein [Paenibacillus aceris]|uniref:Uncharacterized protein n=1 Tax=Paenibacillus aceris TaxID=869555 RepID=A0ABS4HTV5_9BACL|nr:hypothetical protein [Paenibacillus aceris]MBP1962062.1 hypothetical protein [Paenibacillus aceris]NHW34089.1 hypothetical protein [Paenibacillus aceris]
MAKSQAQKLRQRNVREGKLDPAIHRLHWNGVNPVSKRTPSLKELQAKQQHKHKSRNLNHRHGDDSFFHASLIIPSVI